MPYTFLDLKNELRPILFPTGEAENLVGAHNSQFESALVDLQDAVDCLKINNVTVVPACNTLFKCGRTLFDRPQGRIKRIYTIDKINQTTGLEDSTVADDWCSEVEYRQVEYADLEKYISTALSATGPEALTAYLGAMVGAASIALPSFVFRKWTFPAPDDAGLSKAPALPMGHHYAQPSTDDPVGRAQFGLWAFKGGQVVMAPWIQSTETIVVEWDGAKATWNDLDLVNNDKMLKVAVEEYVRWQHEEKYGRDEGIITSASNAYARQVQALYHRCNEQNRVGDSSDRRNNMAQGASNVVPTFVNEAQSNTAYCPDGYTGNPVNVTVPAGTVLSLVSVADANSKALSQALQMAGAQLDCTPPPTVYYNTAQQFTANCGTGSGNPNTVSVAARAFTSLVSLAEANAAALASASAQATAGLSCTYLSTAQSYTASCPAGTTGTAMTKTIPAGAYTSTQSQADADALALAAATKAANDALVCDIPPTVYRNTSDVVLVNMVCTGRGIPPVTLSAQITTTAGIFTSLVSQQAANQAAHDYAVMVGQAQLFQQCAARHL